MTSVKRRSKRDRRDQRRDVRLVPCLLPHLRASRSGLSAARRGGCEKSSQKKKTLCSHRQVAHLEGGVHSSEEAVIRFWALRKARQKGVGVSNAAREGAYKVVRHFERLRCELAPHRVPCACAPAIRVVDPTARRGKCESRRRARGAAGLGGSPDPHSGCGPTARKKSGPPPMRHAKPRPTCGRGAP